MAGMKPRSGGLVYSTDAGRMCPACRRPLAQCACRHTGPRTAGDGVVRVSRASVTLNVLRAGDCFGEMLYFSAPVARRTTTITSLQSSLVIEIKAASLNQASDGCQVKFNRAFLRILLERLTFANARLAAA